MAKKRSIPFDEAREFIRTQCIGSRKQYTEWHKANKPKQIPRYPNRAYGEEWDGWNDFLGTDNKFDNTKKKWRPISEAIAWVHQLQLDGEKEWLAYCKENRETMPQDIPTRPDIVYNDWRSWMHWLGNRIPEKIEAQQEISQSSTIFYVMQEKEFANHSTIFTFGIERGGVSGLKDQWQMTKDFYVIKMFEYDGNKMEDVQKVIDTMSTGYYGSNKIRICPNINELVWEIANYLEIAQIR